MGTIMMFKVIKVIIVVKIVYHSKNLNLILSFYTFGALDSVLGSRALENNNFSTINMFAKREELSTSVAGNDSI